MEAERKHIFLDRVSLLTVRDANCATDQINVSQETYKLLVLSSTTRYVQLVANLLWFDINNYNQKNPARSQ